MILIHNCDRFKIQNNLKADWNISNINFLYLGRKNKTIYDKMLIDLENINKSNKLIIYWYKKN